MEYLKHRSDWDARLKAMAEAAKQNRQRMQDWADAHSDPEPSAPIKTPPLTFHVVSPLGQTKR